MNRIDKLKEIMDCIDNSFGIGLEEITENTDIDEYIQRFVKTFTVDFDMLEELCTMNESDGLSYLEKLNEI